VSLLDGGTVQAWRYTQADAATGVGAQPVTLP